MNLLSRDVAWMIGRTIAIVVFLIGSLWVFAKVFSLTYPFWFAALFAWMLQPVARFFQQKLRFSRGFASLFGLLGGILVISAILTGLVFLIYFSLRQFFEQVPTWIEEGSEKMQIFFNETVWPYWQQVLGLFDTIDVGTHNVLSEGIDQLGTVLGNFLGDIGQGVVDFLTTALLGLPNFLVAFLFIILSIYFMGKSWSYYQDVYDRHVPLRLRKKGKEFVQAIRRRLFGFLRAQFILMFVTACIVFVGLLIIQIDNAWMLAIVVGIAELLPYLGTGTILIPWFIYLFITGDVSGGFGIAILYIIVVIIRQLLEPKVLSSHMNLNPIAVLISLFAGLRLFGAFGLFLGPAILVFIVILNDIGFFRAVLQFIRNGFTEPEQ
ncbi:MULTISPECIES: sporulation integral membrane protein YtvI [Shouchella]|uniref:Transporter n=2 Tax=Shouchella clausii TaxID=79880 RepID=Q5WGI5_SHOC1|nr:sporulation integral membrane protein YtvI [Shouchella clausii]BAD64520.1 transporter [Shouchella clausii KSM-K16]PAE84827.1 sporulation integral membrane protein YtvI [Shouchella clausii]PAE90785.1 sporulation integral membrane protein YtvI [Shouchella clausii]PAE95409.1 sporulation integral membrane protein YtvI [Shouchella clausii]